MNDDLAVKTEAGGRYYVLLATLLVLILGLPLLHEVGLGEPWVANVLFLGVLASCVSATIDDRRWLKTVVGLGILVVVADWVQLLGKADPVAATDHVLRAAFLIVTIGLILRYVIRGHRVTPDMIAGALCVYLLIGLTWAEFYGLSILSDPDALRLPADETTALASAVGHRAQTVYFSFVTLTTLGYGDITPANSVTRSMAIVQATVGQIYLTVLVARLVGLHIAHGQPGRPVRSHSDS